jgi:PadR family transcriptional regulator, regulatory protein PadR
MGRRRAGELLPIELGLLAAAIELDRADAGDCYGYALAKALASGDDARRMVGHGTLYKALGRLTGSGLLESWWEQA